MDGREHQKSNFKTYQHLPKMPDIRLLFGCTKRGRGQTKLLIEFGELFTKTKSPNMFKFDPSTNSIDNYVSKITNVDSALKKK